MESVLLVLMPLLPLLLPLSLSPLLPLLSSSSSSLRLSSVLSAVPVSLWLLFFYTFNSIDKSDNKYKVKSIWIANGIITLLFMPAMCLVIWINTITVQLDVPTTTATTPFKPAPLKKKQKEREREEFHHCNPIEFKTPRMKRTEYIYLSNKVNHFPSV